MHHTTPAPLKPGKYAVYNGKTYTSQVWNVTAEGVSVTTAPSGFYPAVSLGTLSHAHAAEVLALMGSRAESLPSAEVPAPARVTIGKAAARVLHVDLARLGFRNHYATAAEALGRAVSSLASLTPAESATVRSYARGQWGLA